MAKPGFKLDFVKSSNINIQDFKVDSILDETFSNIGPNSLVPTISNVPNKINISSYEITNFQKYNPIYSMLFDLTPKNYNEISLNHRFHICNLNEIQDMTTGEKIAKPIFVKFSPLLDPIRYMIGKYDINNGWTTNLPTYDVDTDVSINMVSDPNSQSNKEKTKIVSKMCNPLNASYIDAFFSYLTSITLHEHGVQHGVDFYGSFLGIQKRFKTNIEDDLEYLSNSDFFNENIGKIMTIENQK